MSSTLFARARRVLFSLVLEHTQRERESLKRERRERLSAPIETRSFPRMRDARGLSFFSLSDFYSARREADAMIVPHETRAQQCVTRVRIIFFRWGTVIINFRSTEVKLFFVERLLGSNNHLGELRKKNVARARASLSVRSGSRVQTSLQTTSRY